MSYISKYENSIRNQLFKSFFKFAWNIVWMPTVSAIFVYTFLDNPTGWKIFKSWNIFYFIFQVISEIIILGVLSFYAFMRYVKNKPDRDYVIQICSKVLGDEVYSALVNVGKSSLPEIMKLAILKDYSMNILSFHEKEILKTAQRNLDTKGIL